MIKRGFSFLFVILLLISFPCFGDESRAGEPMIKDVIFSATPFVRIGFSSVYGGTAVEPNAENQMDTASFVSANGVITTGNLYLYAQVFTVHPVSVTIEGVKALGNEYQWETTFYPVDNEQASNVEIKTSDGLSTAKPLFSELGDNSINLSYPRAYWWRFNVALSDPNYAQPTSPVEAGSITVKVSAGE